MQSLYRAETWHDDALALGAQLARDLCEIYNSVPGLKLCDSNQFNPNGLSDEQLVWDLAGPQYVTYKVTEDDPTFSSISVRFRIDIQEDMRKVSVGVNWPSLGQASPELALAYAQAMTRAASVASMIKMRVERFLSELRPDPIDEEKRAANEEAVRRRNILMDEVRHGVPRDLAEYLLGQYAADPLLARTDAWVEMEFTYPTRRKLKECAKVLEVKHRRGKTSLFRPTELGMEYLRQKEADAAEGIPE